MVLLGIACQNGRLLHMGDHNPYVETRRVVNMAHRHSDMEAEWTQQIFNKKTSSNLGLMFRYPSLEKE